jgi:hypothetical protein
MAIAEQDMHPAVRLILARMETDPGEFVNTTRWEKVLDTCRTFCSEEERNALSEKYRLIRMDAIHVEAMKVITHANDPEPEYGADVDMNAVMQGKQTAMQTAMQQMKADQVMQQMGLQHDKEWQDRLNGLLKNANQSYGLAQSAPRLMPPYSQAMSDQSNQRPSRTGRIIGGLLLGKTNK